MEIASYRISPAFRESTEWILYERAPDREWTYVGTYQIRETAVAAMQKRILERKNPVIYYDEDGNQIGRATE